MSAPTAKAADAAPLRKLWELYEYPSGGVTLNTANSLRSMSSTTVEFHFLPSCGSFQRNPDVAGATSKNAEMTRSNIKTFVFPTEGIAACVCVSLLLFL